MNESDNKKIFLIAIIILLIGGVSIFLILNSKKDSYKEADREISNKASKVLDYIAYSTRYYTSKFEGTDILFNSDKTTKSDLSNASILRLATSYVNKELDSKVSDTLIEQMVKEEGINKDLYTFYNGKQIRQAIKDLFDIDFKDQSVTNEKGFKYNYEYYSTYDVYLVSTNETYSSSNSYQIDYKVIKTYEDKDGNLKVEFVVAYVYIDENNNTLKYSSNSDCSDFVYEVKTSDAGIKEEDKFTKYNLFLKKSNDKYVFDSIENVK